MSAREIGLVAGALALVLAARPPAGLPAAAAQAGAAEARGDEGVEVLYDFEPGEAKVNVYAKIEKGMASHGEHALSVDMKGQGGGRMDKFCPVSPEPNRMKALPELMAMPPSHDYHDVMQWYYERYCAIFDECGVANRMSQPLRDWSGFDRLRFDVYAKDAPAILGLSVRDGTGPRFFLGFTGVRSGNAIFNAPAGKWVTCEFPLKEMARLGNLDLKKAQGFFLHFNGFQGDTPLYVDYFRLVATGAEEKVKSDVIAPSTNLAARLYKVVKTPPLKKDPENLKRDVSPVEKLGPVTVTDHGGFGGLGVTYCNTVRRGVVAYDNRRIAFLSHGGGDKASRKVNPDSVGGGGIYAHATFDGGQTWGGMTPGENLPTHLNTWYSRAGASADYATGQVYLLGTENCQSYMGGYDATFRSLDFDGHEWTPHRVSVVDNNFQKCPLWCHVLRTENGRLWACWCDGRSALRSPSYTLTGFPHKYSDDGGLTWFPCRNGDSEEPPHPLYTPDLKDLDKAHERAPNNIIQIPAELIPGPMMVPYKGSLASFSPPGTHWAAHDGKAWDVTVRDVKDYEKWNKIPPFGASKGYAESTVVSVEDKHVFVCKGGNYRLSFYEKDTRDTKHGKATSMVKLEQEQQTDLAVAHWDGDAGQWSSETLETERVWESILTASGDAVFCFYAKVEKTDGDKKIWTVFYRRWADGTWGEAVKVAEDPVRISRLAAPQRCPPSYAAVLWDHVVQKGEPGPDGIRFARVPNK
ncbi:MAG: sialidase family protein [Planctomycetota bacterium]